MMTEDPRRTGLKNGLRQLNVEQLERALCFQGEMVLDEFNYQDGKFCPLGIALELDKTMENPTHDKVFQSLTDLGYQVYNTRGIEGSFYTDNRREDLLAAAQEVLTEKINDCPCLSSGRHCGVCRRGSHIFCSAIPHGTSEEAYEWFIRHPEHTVNVKPITPSPEHQRAMKEIIRRNAAK